MYIQKINNKPLYPNFKSIKLSAKEIKDSKELVNNLRNKNLNTIESESFYSKLYRIFIPHLKKEAAHKASTYNIYRDKEDVLAELQILLLKLIQNIKKDFSLDNILEEINNYMPSKETVPLNSTHLSIDNTINNGSHMTHVDYMTSARLPMPKSEITIEKEHKKLKKTINNTELTIKIKDRLEKRAKGESYRKIASKENISEAAVRRAVKVGILKMQAVNNCIPDDKSNNINTLAKMFNCSTNKILKAAEYCPPLISKSPELIMGNIQDLSKLSGASIPDIIKSGLRHPQIFVQNPETMINNIKTLTELAESSFPKIVKAALKKPQIFIQNPETMINNAKKLAGLSGEPTYKIIKAAIKQPQIFSQNPETLLNNVKKLAKLIEIPIHKIIKAALSQPQLFNLKPQTVINKIEKLAELFEISTQEIIEAGLKQPPIFCLNPENIMKKVEKLAELFGVSAQKIIEAGLKQPPIFCLNPENIMKKVEKFAKLFEVSEQEIIQAGLKQPNLFFMKPESYARKIKIRNYYNKIRHKENTVSITKKSEDALYLSILHFLLKDYLPKNQKISVNHFNLKQFTKENSEQTFKFEIPEGEVAKDFINYAKKSSQNFISKNIFFFKIKKSQKKCT